MNRALPYLCLCAMMSATIPAGAQTYEPYTVSTLAGVAAGTDDGVGTAARFRLPAGVAVDGAGNVYVADSYNGTIRKITPAGVVSTFAGAPGYLSSVDGAGMDARFWYPQGVALDGAGNLYVAGYISQTIRKITPAGVVTTVAGLTYTSGSADGSGDAARFSSPEGVVVDNGGNVLIADTGNHTIRKMTPAGVVTTWVGLAGTSGTADGAGTAARFNRPHSLVLDVAGNVYVSDTFNQTIRKITPAGVVSTFAGSPGQLGTANGVGSAARFSYPDGLAIDSNGNVYVADSLNNTIRKISSAGVVTTLAGLAGQKGSADGVGSAARFRTPKSLAFDGTGNLIVTDNANHSIRTITPAGEVTTFAGVASEGSSDGGTSLARFSTPRDIAVDPSGNAYVADYANNTIRKITPEGVVSTFAGAVGTSGSTDGTGSAARFGYPQGIAADGNGTLYVADTSNHTIRKITPSGTVTTFAGLAGFSGTTDGQASAARFHFPVAVAADIGGNVYVADRSNHTIRKITPAGVVSTLAGMPGVPGSSDGQGSVARFNFLEGLGVDPAGNVFVADGGNYTVRKITPGGLVTTLAGSAGVSGSTDATGSAARFGGLYGLAVDLDGNVYVADTTNQSIRKITPAGVVRTVGGYSGVSGSRNGPGSLARFWDPEGIAVDSSGNIYVADTRNNAIRVAIPAPPPANDSFAAAASLSGEAGRLDGHNVGATVEPGEPQQAGYTAAHSVWFTWTPPKSGVYAFQLRHTSFNSLFALYTGSQLNGLTLVKTGNFQSRAVIRAVVGTTYYIKVDGYSGGAGGFTLTWNLSAGQPNDDFANAQPISGVNGSISGDTSDSTVEPNEPNHAGASPEHSIWYAWTAPHDGRFVFEHNGATYGTGLALYSGSTLSALTPMADTGAANNVQRLSFQATGGTTYMVAVFLGYGSYAGPTLLSWHVASPPPNDNFANAQELNGMTGSVTATNADATRESGEPVHYSGRGGASIWFKWTAPASGHLLVKVGNLSTISSLMGIYTGSAVNALRGVARNGHPARAQVEVTAGVVYYIAFDDYYADLHEALVLSWDLKPPQQTAYEPYAFTTLAGSPPANIDAAGSSARFNNSDEVALGPDGNIYVADTRNQTIRKVTPAGTVTTLAGAPGERGTADGTGAAARFYNPGGIAVDEDGVIYVTDSINHTIRRISPAGEVTTLAGSPGRFGSLDGVGSNALFDTPGGLVVHSGHIYVADSENHTIRKITFSGEVSTIAGSPGLWGDDDGPVNGARFSHPADLVIDSSGNLFVADAGNYTIRKITPAGVVSTFAGAAGFFGASDGAASDARFGNVFGLTIDGSGNLYCADSGNHTIRKITPAGVVTTIAGLAGAAGDTNGAGNGARFREPRGIVATTAATLYVADTGNSTLRTITSSGNVSTLAGARVLGSTDGTGSAALFNSSAGVAVDAAGNAYVADTANHTIRKITPAGVTTTFAGLAGVPGSTNGTGGAARFRSPRGLVVDPAGNVYVADTSNHLVRKITPAGAVTTFAGSTTAGAVDGTGSAARFRGPGGISIDTSGNLYVADTGNNTVRKITPGGVVTTVAGAAGLQGKDDGTGTAARFNAPRGITVDPAGNLFIADTNNHTIRKVTPDGVVTTVTGTANAEGGTDGTLAEAMFWLPYSIAADAGGNLFVADRNNHLIRKISAAGIVTTVAGARRQNGSQDSAGSAARFDSPGGIAIGPDGRVYVADTMNHAIRVSAVPLVLTSARSTKVHGTAGTFSIPMPLTGTPALEPRRGGANGDHTIVFSFDRQISSGTATVTGGTASFAGNPRVSGNELIVNLTGVANAQTLALRLDNVADTAGQALPETTISIRFLLGDTTRDGFVNSGDALQTRNRAGQALSVDNFFSDANTDGLINSGDATIVRARSGSSVPGAAERDATGN